MNGVGLLIPRELLRYTGRWVKKGFTLRTNASGIIDLKLINNAPGGGGNDWALDDIAVATCYPNLVVNPLPLYTTCADNVANFGATVTIIILTITLFTNGSEVQTAARYGMMWV